jgi:hypothetical protein
MLRPRGCCAAVGPRIKKPLLSRHLENDFQLDRALVSLGFPATRTSPSVTVGVTATRQVRITWTVAGVTWKLAAPSPSGMRPVTPLPSSALRAANVARLLRPVDPPPNQPIVGETSTVVSL